ncbi:hypothetical protein QQS21_001212 [Conoideocrella luteorostrata]|uniref:Uncharacterized protein n=1 Tax=Conoideocrella luteorostrata TaxID=1105319 RepID=A0AAJ0CXM6_9HYPO|nr:hypothetical protein QQS21_001212 [Conoideocrella luteorostrata]
MERWLAYPAGKKGEKANLKAASLRIVNINHESVATFPGLGSTPIITYISSGEEYRSSTDMQAKNTKFEKSYNTWRYMEVGCTVTKQPNKETDKEIPIPELAPQDLAGKTG